jgi:DNA-binding winged helix-turn-helix (wHTH) protein/Tol biopolymer transport system component
LAATIFEFGEFKLDCDRFELSRAGRSLKLERKPMELLILLASRNGRLVTRGEIADCLWEPGVFVDIDHGINTVVRKIRHVLRDDPGRPRFVQTVSGKGYRFVSDVVVESTAHKFPVNGHSALSALREEEVPGKQEKPLDLIPLPPVQPERRRFVWPVIASLAISVLAGIATYSSFHVRPHGVEYTQLTDFTDSAVAPALSPDGHMVAFIRGSSWFWSADPIYVKILPDGEARKVTDEKRVKYGPVFSPGGSQIAYTAVQDLHFVTSVVSVLGGDSQLFLNNAAGLSWLDRNHLLFSRVRSGLHMGIVTGPVTGQQFRELYFPAHERAMAHYSYASPDRKTALVVEMDDRGSWDPCRIISLDGRFASRRVGPTGPCTSAGWSPDGSLMYFSAEVKGEHHLWRQAYPDGQPEQITFDPTEEEGVAVEPSGRSLITSLGVHESAIWFHDARRDRALSSEGEVVNETSSPSFSADDKFLYFLKRHQRTGSEPELWRVGMESGKSEAVFPGISMRDYDISADGKQVLYSSASSDGRELWWAPLDRSSPARRIDVLGATFPHFGRGGKILFLGREGNVNYLEQINQDGSGRSKVLPYPIIDFVGFSPGRRWLMAAVTFPSSGKVIPAIIPLAGGSPRAICATPCYPRWSLNGRWLFVPVEDASESSAGRSLAIPIGPGETLPELPPGGIEPDAELDVIPGAQLVNRAEFAPAADPSHYAYVNTTVHRNL